MSTTVDFEQLRNALALYGRHLKTCPPESQQASECACGLNDVLAEAYAAAPPQGDE